MRINSETTGSVGAVRPKGDTAPVASSKAADAADTKDVISVSSAAQLVASARDKIANIPVVRASMVEAIQSQMNSGTYKPDNGVVADRLLREHMLIS